MSVLALDYTRVEGYTVTNGPWVDSISIAQTSKTPVAGGDTNGLTIHWNAPGYCSVVVIAKLDWVRNSDNTFGTSTSRITTAFTVAQMDALTLADAGNVNNNKQDKTDTDATPTNNLLVIAEGANGQARVRISQALIPTNANVGHIFNWQIEGDGWTPASGNFSDGPVLSVWSDAVGADREATVTVNCNCGAGGDCGNCTRRRMLKIAVIKVESVELVSGATSDHVVPTNTWVTVKNTNATPEYVILQAVINPAIDESALPANFISWTGGEAVGGHPLQRRVSKQTAAHTAVIASCGSSSATGDVWIVWASVEIKMSGTTPANAAQFGEYYDATEILGVRDYQYEGGGNAAAGKVIPTGMLTPSGVYNVVSNGWDIKREMIRHDYKDGAVWQSRWIEVWTDDPPNDESVKKLHPDNADQIYDLDAPNIAKFQGSQGIVANSCERYDNFRQWVTWNKNKCSDYSLWYWFARGKDDTNSDFQVELKDVGVGNPAFPTNVPYYSPP